MLQPSMEHSHVHLTAFPSPRELQHSSWAVNYYPKGQASWLIRTAHYGNMPLPLHSSHISCLKEAAFAPHFAPSPPIHLNQTGSLSCSCPHSNGLPPEWCLQHPPNCSWHREHTAQQCMADSADNEATALLNHNHCIL